jgi:hypothetical protein
MRNNLSWLAIFGSFVCSLLLRFSALAAVQHVTAAVAEQPAPANAEISALRK